MGEEFLLKLEITVKVLCEMSETRPRHLSKILIKIGITNETQMISESSQCFSLLG